MEFSLDALVETYIKEDETSITINRELFKCPPPAQAAILLLSECREGSDRDRVLRIAPVLCLSEAELIDFLQAAWNQL